MYFLMCMLFEPYAKVSLDYHEDHANCFVNQCFQFICHVGTCEWEISTLFGLLKELSSHVFCLILREAVSWPISQWFNSFYETV